MMPFGGGTGRVGRSRMRLDEMDCADIMMKAVQRKRSRSIARRESFSGTEDDLRKFRDAVEANDKESKVLAADLQKDIDEYAVKVRQIRGEDSQKKTEKEENTSVIRTDNEDTNLEKLPVKEDKCAIKTNSNNLGENQSDCVSTAKNINEGVKNSEHSYGDTKDLNGDKKNESTASEEGFEQVTKPNELQSHNDPEEVSNYEQNGTSENLESQSQDKEGSKVDDTNANDESVNLNCNGKNSCTKEEVNTDLCAEELSGENATNEESNVQEVEKDITDAQEEDLKVQEDEKDVTTAPEEDLKVQDEVESKTAVLNEDCKIEEDLEEKTSALEKINDQQECGELTVDGDNIETEKEATNENGLAQVTQENSTHQEMISQEPEVQTQNTQPDDLHNEEIGADELTTDSNAEAIESDVKTEGPIENRCEAQTHAVQITDVVSDQPQEANFLSIVDRIKTDITTLKTLSKSGTNASVNVNNEVNELINGTQNAAFENEKILNGPKQSSHSNKPESEASKSLDNSQVKISKELSSHLINLSSANISEQLRKSCSNIVAMNQDFSKEFLLKKLEELLKQESKQVSEDLERRREQLRETQTSHANDLRKITERHKNELTTLKKQQAIKLAKIENLYLDEIEDTRKEIELLENEQQNVKPQNQIINDCIR